MREPYTLPTSTCVLPLARKRRLVPRLAEALARAQDLDQQPLMRQLQNALALGRQLESEMRQIRITEPAPGTADRVLEGVLQLSMKLGRALRKARDLVEIEAC